MLRLFLILVILLQLFVEVPFSGSCCCCRSCCFCVHWFLFFLCPSYPLIFIVVIGTLSSDLLLLRSECFLFLRLFISCLILSCSSIVSRSRFKREYHLIQALYLSMRPPCNAIPSTDLLQDCGAHPQFFGYSVNRQVEIFCELFKLDRS